MSLRAMNNKEKANAAILKKNGFHVFWQYTHRGTRGDWWATHHKLICQYCVKTKADDAIRDLDNVDNEERDLCPF